MTSYKISKEEASYLLSSGKGSIVEVKTSLATNQNEMCGLVEFSVGPAQFRFCGDEDFMIHMASALGELAKQIVAAKGGSVEEMNGGEK